MLKVILICVIVAVQGISFFIAACKHTKNHRYGNINHSYRCMHDTITNHKL